MKLTQRQKEVLTRIASSQNVKTIGCELNLSPKTVEYHRSKVYEAIGARDVAGLTRFAIRQGFIVPIILLFMVLSASAGNVTLAWGPSPSPGVTGYNLYYGGASHTYTNVIDCGTNTTCTVSNLIGGATYYFAATAYNAVGLESDYSAELSYTMPVINVRPAPPTDLVLKASTIEGRGMPFSNLRIERSDSPAGPWTLLGSVLTGADGSFTFIDLNPPAVRAFYRAGY